MTSEDIEKAKRIVSTWAWQPAEGQLYRYKYAINTYTRFYESPSLQPDEIKLVIEYLKSGYEETKIELLGKKYDFGGKWVAKSAWLQTMPGEKWNGTESTRVRIYQILAQPNESGQTGDGPYSIEDGCQYKVEHTFFWNVETMPKVPKASSGVEWRMLSVSRNDETGYFTCVLEKRERVQQDVAEYGAAETAFESRKEEQHLGVKQEKVASTGKAASVGSGKMVERQIRKNADCTSDVVNVTRQEKSAPGAVVVVRKSLRGTTKTVTDRNQSSKLGEKGLKVGEERRSEQTEGKLWNNTVSTTTGEGAGKIGEECTKSAGEHTHIETENVAEKPTTEIASTAVNEEERIQARQTEERTWDVVRTKVRYTPKTTGAMVGGSALVRQETTVGVDQPTIPTGGQGGVNEVISISASPNNHGSFSTQKQVTRYTPKTMQFVTGTVDQVETVTEGANVPTVSVGGVGANESVSLNVGFNEHGSMTTNMRRVRYIPRQKSVAGGTVGASEVLTIGKDQTVLPNGSPSQNVRDDVTFSLNDHGTANVQRRRTVYHRLQGVSVSTNAVESVRTTVVVNDTNLNPSAKRGTASVSPNDHGSATTSVAEVTTIPVDSGWIKWKSTNETPTGVYHCKHGLRIFRNLKAVPAIPSSVNCQPSISINQWGLFDGYIAYSDLTSFSQEGRTGTYGGIQEGQVTFWEFMTDAQGKKFKRKMTAATIAYYGSGNEGSIASAKANAKHYPGLSLGRDVFLTSEPVADAEGWKEA